VKAPATFGPLPVAHSSFAMRRFFCFSPIALVFHKNLAPGSFKSDDLQVGRPTAPLLFCASVLIGVNVSRSIMQSEAA
jgi:hypothetical protein